MTRVLLAGLSQYEWFAPAWVRALQELGIEVHFFDVGRCFSTGWMGRIENHWMIGPGVSRVNQDLLKMAMQTKPDVVLLHNGNPFLWTTVSALADRFYVAGYHHDNPFGDFGEKGYFRLFRKAIPFYSFHHVIRPENIRDYVSQGVSRVRLLMTYYVPWIHYPRNHSPSCWEVVFAGHVEPDHRIRYVEDLLKAGIPLKLFGSPEWPKYLAPPYRGLVAPVVPLPAQEYAQTLSTAKICLAFYSGGNRDLYSYRVFEIPACGGFLLAERTSVMQSLYEEGKEAEFFDSSEELIDKIRFYLSHDQERARIAEQGHRRCLASGYDVLNRMKQWLRDVEEFRQ